jgi:hypothetical protein
MIINSVELNSKQSVDQGDCINLDAYCTQIKEQNGQLPTSELARTLAILKNFALGHLKNKRAANNFDNVSRCLDEFLIAHPATGSYTEGTFLGNSTSLRVRRFVSTAREKWGPALDTLAMFFVLAPLTKRQFEEILQKMPRNRGRTCRS